MIKITIKRYNGIPLIREGKVIVTQEQLEEVFYEEYDTLGVEDVPGFRQSTIERSVMNVTRFNYEEEEKARRDKKNPKARIRKLIISSIN
jgi:hypothetical protein